MYDVLISPATLESVSGVDLRFLILRARSTGYSATLLTRSFNVTGLPSPLNGTP
jgi:hypothetical protein